MTEQKTGISLDVALTALLIKETEIQNGSTIQVALGALLKISDGDFSALRNNIIYLQNKQLATLVSVERINQIITGSSKMSLNETGAEYLRNNDLLPNYKLTDRFVFRCNIARMKKETTIDTDIFDGLVECVDSVEAVTFQIQKRRPVTFREGRMKIARYLYEARGDRKWKTYDDIKEGANVQSSEYIRKAVESINEEAHNATKGYVLIRIKPGDKPAPNEYRWQVTKR